MDHDGLNWAATTADVDQTLAALRETEYQILRFTDGTREFVDALIEHGITRLQAANIIHGMAMAAIFPEAE